MIVAGRTFFLRDQRMGEHLWFVLTDPDAVTNQVVIVMLVSERSHTDKTTSLVPGDHPFVQHASNVAYGTATFRPAGKIETALKNGVATLQADASPELLQRVRVGLLTSGFTPNVIAAHCAERFPSTPKSP